MYAIKVELKLNNKHKTLMAQHAGCSRFVCIAIDASNGKVNLNAGKKLVAHSILIELEPG